MTLRDLDGDGVLKKSWVVTLRPDSVVDQLSPHTPGLRRSTRLVCLCSVKLSSFFLFFFRNRFAGPAIFRTALF